MVDTEFKLLEDYLAAIAALTPETSAEEWRRMMSPLVQRTIALLKRDTGETETYSVRELLPRFAQEDIEVYANVTIAVVHSNDNEEGEPMLDTSITTLHFPSNDEVDATQFEDNMSLLDVAARFGIDPDDKVWEVNSDYL